jgi:ribose-phosphate pyrophosphokinase
MIKLNGHKIDVTLFPDHTSQVWKLPTQLFDSPKFLVEWDFQNEAELIHMAQLKALLDLKARPTDLHIRYLPYARQDKETANQATFALRPFATLLNTLKFDKILIDDPHSSIATTLIQRSEAIYPVKKVQDIANLVGADLVCYPDKGARTRYSAIYEFESIYGEKVRNQLTGHIDAYDVVGNPSGKKVLIIDDICDGGATFTILARDLLKQGALSVDLFVTHGLFSKGLEPLLTSGIKRIFTQKGEAFETQGQITYKETGL